MARGGIAMIANDQTPPEHFLVVGNELSPAAIAYAFISRRGCADNAFRFNQVLIGRFDSS
jgi:hypothetical protein